MSRAHVKLEWTPHDGQRAVLDHPARYRIVACGRRWGKTEMSAHEAVRYLGEPDTLVWWVAPTYDIADIGFSTVEDAIPEPLIADVKRTKPKAIDCANGSRISFRSADREDSLRGEGLDLLILDEAAMIPERAWASELRPTLSDTRGDMIAISTPKGRGWFYRWFQHGESDDRPNTASWQQPTERNPHIPAGEIDDAANELPERVFQQEYLAEFIDESGGVFKNLDAKVFTADYTLPDEGLPPLPEHPDDEREGVTYATPPYATGVDFAQTQDWRVTLTLDAEGRVVYFDRQQGEGWPQIQAKVERVADRYPGLVAVDATRRNKIVGDLKRAGVEVEPVTFSASAKQALIEDLITRVENGELMSPDIPQLRQELELFEYDLTRHGNVRYDAPEGFHDDTVDALALAASVLERGHMASATARVGPGADEPADRRRFRESEIGRAVSELQNLRR